MLDPSDFMDGCKDNVLSQEADFRLTRALHRDTISLQTKWWTVLIEIEGSINDFIAKAEKFLAEHDDPNAEDEAFIVPVAYDATDCAAVKPRQPVVIFARQEFVHVLNRRNGGDVNRFGVLSLHLGAVVPRRYLSFDADWPDTSPIPVAEGTVVMAVVDDGLGIANNLFRTGPFASRVHYAAILEAEPVSDQPQTSVGRVWDKAGIETLLEGCTYGGLLDEDLFYTLSGQVDFYDQTVSGVAYRASHGTHVMGLAAGHPMEDGRNDRPIICVALPTRLVEDTSGVDMLPTFYLAFQMLAKQALRFRLPDNRPAPVMFNLSYGNAGGPHDGTGLYAELFEHFFGKDGEEPKNGQKAWLTLPAGNVNLNRMHALAEPGDSETQWDLFLQADDRTSTSVQIWMPYTGQAPNEVAEISVVTPFGQGGAILTDGRPCFSLRDHAGHEIARLSYEFSGGRTQRGFAVLSINPTASLSVDEPLAPSGTWKIKVRRKPEAKGQIQAWVRRDETLPGFKPGGRQAFFDNPGYKRFGPFGEPLAVDPPDTSCPVRRAGTLSGFACGETPIVVAAFSEKQTEMSDYSSSGPLNRPASPGASKRIGPDLSAPGDQSRVVRGVLGAGSRSGTIIRAGGTSNAAPQMARAAADAIATPGLEGREWATDPTAYSANLRQVDLCPETSAERMGSGAYRLKTD